MAGTDIADNLLTAGQNEGVERSVLPMPQLAGVVNARLRKQSRWGKRYGHTSLSTTNLGSGTNSPRCIGGAGVSGFAIVDDRCCVYNSTAAAFVDPTRMYTSASTNLRYSGAVSGWLPGQAFFPSPSRLLQRQDTTGCATCYALGYLWTAHEFGAPTGTDTWIRVIATDPTNQTVVFSQELPATGAGFGGTRYPRLIAVGSRVALTYRLAVGAATYQIRGRTIASVTTNFSVETTIDSTANLLHYDATPYSSTQFLMAFSRTGAVGFAKLINVSTLTAAASGNLADTAIFISIAGSPTAGAFVAYNTAAPSTKTALFTTALVLSSTTAISAAPTDTTRPLITLLSGGGARVVYGSPSAVSFVSFFFADVSATNVYSGVSIQQAGMEPIAVPFAVGSTVYLWARVYTDGRSPYPTLLRLPQPDALGVTPTALPLEMSIQDFPATAGKSATVMDLQTVSQVTQIGTNASYALVYGITYQSQANALVVWPGVDFRVALTTHFTDTASQRSVSALYADSSAFVPLGTLTNVDDRGAFEEGFLYNPNIISATPGAGGAMTPSSTYSYSAIYKIRKPNGRFEQSGPATPLSAALGAGNSSATVVVNSLYVTARIGLQIEVYRTLANTQTFYLCQVLQSDVTGTVSFVDLLSDAAISVMPALYTQIGQQLPNAFPPASRFGCVGGQRLFLGGLVRPDLVQSSKLIVGDQSPSFCDSDAFRIVLPAACTGLAWMDVLVLFTAEGIYIASGDGPTDDGLGDFGNLTRMPYELGCIEPRSVKVIDDGCFFQTSRGLYLLPRGFGAPVPAGDNVMETLRSFSVITGAATVTKGQEQSVLWSCVESTGGFGARVVYDIAHKAWSVDKYPSQTGTANASTCGMGQWLNGEVALFSDSTTRGLQVTSGGFAEADGSGVAMSLETGDLRPFGTMSEGVISKIDLLAELRSACTLNVTKTTENNTASTSRVFALAAGDYSLGSLAVTEVNLGQQELRNAMSVRVQFAETSTSEGLAFIAVSLEHEQGEGLKRAGPLSRVT